MEVKEYMTRPWDEIEKTIEEHLEHDLKLGFMLDFVREIKSSKYVTGLYAWTSMFDICIVQNEVTYPYDGPQLRVSPKFNGKVEFRYIDTYIKEKQWKRVVNENEVFPMLEKFIDQLHWYVKDKSANET